MRSRVLLPPAALLAASAWCVFLLAVRKHEFGAAGYRYLVWNLTLAWIPLLLAILLVLAYRQRRSLFELLAVGAVWLLFLPNAPYVLTDFIHLGQNHRLYDTIVVASFAFTGLALGFGSLLLVQLVVTRAGGALLGWAVVLASLFLDEHRRVSRARRAAEQLGRVAAAAPRLGDRAAAARQTRSATRR